MLERFVWITRIEKITIQNELCREVLRFLLKMYSAVFMEVLKAGGKMLRHQIVRMLLLYLGGHPSTMCTFCEPTLDTVLWETIFWD